jgi:RNA polymerase sigma factor (TIGR02999 family)
MPPDQQNITTLLNLAAAGEAGAADRLYEAIYSDLHQIAALLVARERPGAILQATCLVHEAYIRLGGNGADGQHWQNRRHFYGAAGRAMQRILIERGRRRRPVLMTLGDAEASVREDDVDWDSLAAALETLRGRDPRMHEVVMLRFFAGQSVENTALLMGISDRLVEKEWHFARVWLHRQLKESSPSSGA